MNPIREFLESSNVHGLVYISKSESTWGKVLWALTVVVSFSLAIILISDSFQDWSDQPVSSVISTRPIRDLNFPNVTICPPENTNTALNYDLVRLNSTFTASVEEKLDMEVNAIFSKSDNKRYMNTLLQIANKKNLKAIYTGFQTLPVHLGQTGFQVKLSGLTGEISSPGFKDENYNEGQNVGYYHYILEIPDKLEQLIGKDGKFVVELEVDIGNTEAASLEYRFGPRYQYSGEGKANWADAEAGCKERGGHLASVTSSEEAGEVRKSLFKTAFTGVQGFWLGGRNNDVAGNWTWVNGAEWGFEGWSLDGSDEDGSVNQMTGQTDAFSVPIVRMT